MPCCYGVPGIFFFQKKNVFQFVNVNLWVKYAVLIFVYLYKLIALFVEIPVVTLPFIVRTYAYIQAV